MNGCFNLKTILNVCKKECEHLGNIKNVADLEKAQEELQKEMEGGEYTISTYGKDSEEWKEAKSNLVEKKKELSRQIELSLSFVELGEILNNSEGDKIWKENEEVRRRESVANQLPTIAEEEIEKIQER